MKFIVFCVIFFIIICPAAFSAQESPFSQQTNTVDLHECIEKTLGVKFLCNPDWELETDEDAVLSVISKDPAVTMTLARSKSPVIFIDQLTPEAVKEMGQYADGFKMTKFKLGDKDAVKVEGYSAKYPEIRLLDFYILHDLYLYSVLFSVDPKEEWSNFETLILTIADSLEFLPN